MIKSEDPSTININIHGTRLKILSADTPEEQQIIKTLLAKSAKVSTYDVNRSHDDCSKTEHDTQPTPLLMSTEHMEIRDLTASQSKSSYHKYKS